MKKTIQCAITGLGRIGSTLEQDRLREKPASHAGAIANHPDCILVSGCDPVKRQREEFSRTWPGARLYTQSKEMLRNETPDIYHIASWTDTHPLLLEEAIDCGIPVIVCEKPLANTDQSLTGVLAKAENKTSRIIINHERRFSQDYRAARQIVKGKKFGNLHTISARLYMGKTRPAGEVLLHDGTHMLDIIRFLSGNELEIRHVSGNGTRKGGGLEVLANAGNINVHLEVAGGRNHLVFELDLSFTRGRIRIGNGIYELWTSMASPYYTGFRSLQKKQDGWSGNTGYFAGMMTHAVELFRNPETVNESSIYDAYAALTAIKTIRNWTV